jgi:hypothetical protein
MSTKISIILGFIISVIMLSLASIIINKIINNVSFTNTLYGDRLYRSALIIIVLSSISIIYCIVSLYRLLTGSESSEEVNPSSMLFNVGTISLIIMAFSSDMMYSINNFSEFGSLSNGKLVKDIVISIISISTISLAACIGGYYYYSKNSPSDPTMPYYISKNASIPRESVSAYIPRDSVSAYIPSDSVSSYIPRTSAYIKY